MTLKRDVVDHDAEVSYSAKDWIILFVALAFQLALIIFVPAFAWVGLPFWFTYVFKAMKFI